MGAYLDKPVEDKNPEYGNNDMCWWGACSMQGWRCGMEDAHICEPVDLPDGRKGMLFGVFDGHGGKEVAVFAQKNYKQKVIDNPNFKSKKYEQGLTESFHALDAEVKKEDYANDTGTTSCVLLITPDKIYCANAGDSRGVLAIKGKPGQAPTSKGLSEDHKPDNPDEVKRIEKANHMVEDSRVDGNLALSRAFGDFQYKDQAGMPVEQQAVTCHPDITVHDRSDQDQFIMLACDGIWDCLSNDECVKTLQEKIDKQVKNNTANKANITKPVEGMLSDILAPNTDEGIGTDNMTAVLIYFPKNMGLA